MRTVITTRSPEETVEIGKSIGALLRGGDVIAYRGDLGAGKTTLTRGISIGMGLGDEVTSPTFALVNEYRKKDCPLSLIHFDMYRITADDVETTGFYDYLSPDAVMAVEWSENIEGALDGPIAVTLERISEEERRITIETRNGDDRFEAIGH